MTSHDWYLEQRALYLIRSLEPEEERRFEDHLARCDECQGEIRALERDLGWLPMGAQPVHPAPGLRWRIVRSVLGGNKPAAWRTWGPVGLAAAALLIAAVGMSRQVDGRRAAERALASANDRLAALTDSLSVMQRAARVLQASIEIEGARGGILIFADSISHRWNVVLHGLPAPEPGMTYRLWYICSDGMVSGRELEPLLGQPLIVTVGMPDRGGDVLGAALSLEPRSNTTDEPKGKELAHLML